MGSRVVGVPQHYDWGDGHSIPALLGFDSLGKSWAELWFGTHPGGPSHLDAHGAPSLESVTGEMKMLVKLLACDKPLSLQTHPTQQQAEAGFRLENAAGIPIDADNRIYKDPADKPEMLIALSRFEALCGFQPKEQTAVLLRQMAWYTEADMFSTMGFAAYMAWAFAQHEPPAMTNAPEWLQRIAERYPTDRALRIAPLLHHVVLAPGEAIALGAGNLHAYLNGFGLEVMRASDNVVRAGFTSKHVDIAELIRIVTSAILENPRLTTATVGEWTLYPSISPAFSIMSIRPKNGVTLLPVRSHRLIFGPFNLDGSECHPQMILQPAHEELVIAPTDGVFWLINQN